ncbi:DEP domain-containing mTOR-interacting protein-like isoform 2-T2 [Clarias gariepinus]
MGPRTAVGPSKQHKVSRNRHGRRSDGYYDDSPVLNNPKSVLKRQVSPEELQRPGGKYLKRSFTIVGDAVGWGFVVRGSSPCHIQAVDPSGPAAAVGIKEDPVLAL